MVADTGVSELLGAGHVVRLLALAAFYPALRYVLHINIFEPISTRLLQQAAIRAAANGSSSGAQANGKTRSSSRRAQANGKGAAKPPPVAPLQVEKLCESLWKLSIYVVFTGMGVAAVWRQPWALDARLLWKGWPRHELTRAVAALYDAQLSFYFSSIFMIIFWEVRRKDFAAMFTHHIVTVALLAASARLSFWRAGAAVMALHDACDVLMEAAKCFNYLGADGPATAAFAAFIVAWAVLRLGIYPLGIVRSAVRDLPAALGGRPPMWWGFVAGLGALLVLHIYWFGLIARVAWMRVSTGGGRDVREDDD